MCCRAREVAITSKHVSIFYTTRPIQGHNVLQMIPALSVMGGRILPDMSIVQSHVKINILSQSKVTI